MTEIDGYTDLEVIGRGGFAVVFKAQQVSVGRSVAIKVLADPSPDDDLVRRFRRESKAVGALSWHPHIAAVVDAGTTTQGQAFIVFELLSGGSLEDRIEQAPMHWTDAISSIIQVADAVEAAHRADVLHRDIKPANILLDRLGVAKLGDFGIASMQDGNKTETGMLATTVAHAAPELFDGVSASAATDVYALGSTFHNLLTGLPPFSPASGERMSATISRIVHEPPPRADPSIVPEQVATVIAHALAKQPQYRPRSAAAFGRALQQAQRELGVAVTAMPVTDAEPAEVAASSAAEPSAAAVDPSPVAGVPVVAPVGQSVAGGPASAEAGTGFAPDGVTPSAPVDVTQDSARTTAAGRKPFSRTIAALGSVAFLLAVALVALLLYPARSSTTAIARTAGGAEVLDFDALAATAMAPPFDPAKAIDRDATTYWGISQNPGTGSVLGTSYVIKLTDQQTIVGVGISHGASTDFGRVAELHWATNISESGVLGPEVFKQSLEDVPDDQLIPIQVTTDQIVLAIVGVHDADAPNVGIAEILIDVEQ